MHGGSLAWTLQWHNLSPAGLYVRKAPCLRDHSVSRSSPLAPSLHIFRAGLWSVWVTAVFPAPEWGRHHSERTANSYSVNCVNEFHCNVRHGGPSLLPAHPPNPSGSITSLLFPKTSGCPQLTIFSRSEIYHLSCFLNS